MNILVTGATGFIGTHLVKRLWDDGHRVTRLDIRPMGISTALNREGAMVVTCPPTDIRDDLALREFERWGAFDACVHLAAIASPVACGEDPSLAYETNVRGTDNVLGLCRRLGVKRVVFPSSAHVYGISPKYLPTDETHLRSMLDVYTRTKVLGEDLCDLYWQNHGLSYAALRFYNVFGPAQSESYFIGRKIAEARRGGPVEMRRPLADVTKDFVWVEDVVDAIVRAIGSDYVGPVNVGTGVETRLRDVVDAVASAHSVEVREVDEGGGGPSRMAADIGRAKLVLGWEPKVRFYDGLARLMERP